MEDGTRKHFTEIISGAGTRQFCPHDGSSAGILTKATLIKNVRGNHLERMVSPFFFLYESETS